MLNLEVAAAVLTTDVDVVIALKIQKKKKLLKPYEHNAVSLFLETQNHIFAGVFCGMHN